MKIFIRQATLEDAAEIAVLSHQLGYSISKEQTLQNIEFILKNKDHDVFVAVNNKQVVGWIGVSYVVQIESPPSCEIRGLVVDDQYRKMGIGKMLIEKIKQWCSEKGNNSLRLRCNIKRIEAHSFYLTLGFKEMKQQKVFEIKLS